MAVGRRCPSQGNVVEVQHGDRDEEGEIVDVIERDSLDTRYYEVSIVRPDPRQFDCLPGDQYEPEQPEEIHVIVPERNVWTFPEKDHDSNVLTG